MTLQALVTRKVDGKTASSIETFDEATLGEGNVTVAVEWSTVNYKDGLALAGAHIMQSQPNSKPIHARSRHLYRKPVHHAPPG